MSKISTAAIVGLFAILLPIFQFSRFSPTTYCLSGSLPAFGLE